METDPETLEEFECVAVLNDHSQDVKMFLGIHQ